MAQPTVEELFGAGSSFNSTTGLTIPPAALVAMGLDASDPSALQVYSTVVSQGSNWLQGNEDETVMAISSLNKFAPTQRDGADRTQYQHSISFYGSYQDPTFDPDDI